jgi:hypothetical protein
VPDPREGPNKSRFGKSTTTPGISPTVGTHELSTRLTKLEKLVTEALHESNQWNTLLREWYGKEVIIELVSEHEVEGKLLWADRYTLCLVGPEPLERKRIVHKGAIATITLSNT